MLIRTTTDPVTLKDVPNPGQHPYILDGDWQSGLLIHFENEQTRKIFQALDEDDHKLVLKGDSSDDYIAEG
ncbi:MAG: hypothetical protein ABFS39_11105 [Pseudomonadota bacterium]